MRLFATFRGQFPEPAVTDHGYSGYSGGERLLTLVVRSLDGHTGSRYAHGMTTDIQEAKTRLAELVREAAHGADVVITVDGVPQARLTPVAPVSTRPWDVRKYAEFWKNQPVDNSRPDSTELVREDRDSRL